MKKDELMKYIKYLRLSHNYTQQQLSENLGISRITLAKMENDGNPTLDTLLKFLNHFNEEISITPKDDSHSNLIRIIGNDIKESILNNMPKSTRHTKYGWVYIFNIKDNLNTIKIGLTHKDDPYERLSIINSHYQPGIDSKNQIELYYARLASDCRKVEFEMHSTFIKNKIQNEWFNVSANLAKDTLDKIINEIDTPHL